MPKSDSPEFVAIKHASDANVRRALLYLCIERKVLQKTLNYLYAVEPQLKGVAAAQYQALKDQSRERERARLAAISAERAEAKELARRRERAEAWAEAEAEARVEAEAEAWVEAQKARARAKAREQVIPTRTTSTARANTTAQAHPQSGHSLTYPEKHRLFPQENIIPCPPRSSAAQAPPASNPPPRVSSSTNKRKAPSTLAVCVQCGEAFDMADNNSHAACQHHDGDLECDPDSDVWCDYYSDHDGPRRDSEESKELFPEAWFWSCCDGDGNQVGCKLGRHAAPATRRQRM